MRTILGVIVLFALAIGAALLAAGNDGYILIILQDLRLQVTLNLAIVVLVAAFFLLYFLVRLLDNLLRLPDGLREARARRRASRA
ncbi:MAG: heme biosynthesis protein HemY, partial [Ottowia sp.]|nr:heme biosynthesis protein HemY [Ottowia sp.]